MISTEVSGQLPPRVGLAVLLTIVLLFLSCGVVVLSALVERLSRVTSLPETQAAIVPQVRQVIGRHGAEPGSFLGPFGVTIGPAGEVVVADDFAHRLSIFDRNGTFVRTVGRHGTGPGELASVDARGSSQARHALFIADTGNNRVQVLEPDGRVARILGPRWFGLINSLRTPRDVLVASNGEIFVADFGNGAVRVFDQRGHLLRSIDGSRRAGSTGRPVQLTVSLASELYVSDSRRHHVVVFGLDGSFRRLIGAPGSGAGQLHGPHGLAFGLDGRLYVADHLNDRVQVFRPDGAPVGAMGRRGQAPGELMRPTDIAVGKEGQIYVVDAGNHRIQVWSPFPAK